MKFEKLCLALLIIVAGAGAGWLVHFWRDYNPMEKYGVSYNVNTGAHRWAKRVDLYWNHYGKAVQGPSIFGDWLKVKAGKEDAQGTPEIIVYNERDETQRAELRLNSTDSTRPEFELVKSNLAVNYFRPWADYYKRNPETEILEPAGANAKN